MAPNISLAQNGNKKHMSSRSKLHLFLNNYANLTFLKDLLYNPESLSIVAVLVVLAELFLNAFIIYRVPYTEIDWIAYMQECEGFLNGTLNYALLKGDTGPLVYPAGFVYIYSILYYITSYGKNICLAQYIFALIYILQILLVIRLYKKSRKVPPYVLLLNIFTSYRIHSIYALRLFNDPIAILFAYISINLFLDEKWTLGSIFYSLGVSVKMNVLLFAPALLVLYITNLGYRKAFQQLVVCAMVQFILGAPFLLSYPIAYIKGSFNLGRVFEHKWTVNYRFLNRAVFENSNFHIFLLGIHICLLITFAPATYTYFKNYCRLRELQRQFEPQIQRQNAEGKRSPRKQLSKDEDLSTEQQKFLDSFEKSLKKSSGKTISKTVKESAAPQTEHYSIQFDKCTQLVLLPLFLCNFIGICCARSLHYQFYVWYFHSLPYLIWCTEYNLGMRFLLLGIIELCWNTYPSTNWSSAMLHACHIMLLFGISRYVFKSHSLINKTK